MTACGLPTETGVNSSSEPLTASVSGAPTSTLPISVSTIEPAAHARDDLARPDGDDDLVGAAPAREPAGGDARPVAGELGRRAVRVPDDDLGARPVGGEHLEDPVGADADVVVAEPADERRLEREADLSPLDEQVVVAEPVPLRESHRRPRPEDDPRER